MLFAQFNYMLFSYSSLADATMKRIARGIEKYWGDYAKPFLAVLYGSSDVRSLDLPFPSVTTSGAHHALVEPAPMLLGQQSCAAARLVDQPVPTVVTAGAISLIQPFITRYHGEKSNGENRNHELSRPIPALDTSNRYALVEPLLVEYYGNGGVSSASEPLKTITTKDRFALLMGHQSGQSPRPVSRPVSTLLAQGRVNLIQRLGMDITLRMLKPHELKRAMSFSDNYVITGNIAEQTKQIGNAVPVETAKALAGAAMDG